MKRALLAGMAALLLAGAAQAEPVILKFAIDQPSNSRNYKGWFLPWMEEIEKASNGTIKWEQYPDGTLGKVGDTIDRVASGIAHAGWDIPPNYGQRYASLAVASLPGIHQDSVKASAALWRSYTKNIIGHEFSAVKLLAVWVGPPVNLFLREKIDNPADLSGLKIATGSKERVQMIAAMGGTPVGLSVSEYYQALQKGVVDGVLTSWAPVWNNKLSDHITAVYPGPYGGGGPVIVMNKEAYESLPPDGKKAIDDLGGEYASKSAAQYLADIEIKNRDDVLADPNKHSYDMTPEQLEVWQEKAFGPVIENWVKNTPRGQEMYDSMKAELAKLQSGS